VYERQANSVAPELTYAMGMHPQEFPAIHDYGNNGGTNQLKPFLKP